MASLRIAKGTAAVAALIGALTLGVSIGVDPAMAACSGVNQSYASGTSWAREDSYGTTCDNDNNYYGVVSDILVDGFTVRVETQLIYSSATWVPTAYTGTSTTFNYSDDNHFTFFRLHRSNGSTGATGSNSGF